MFIVRFLLDSQSETAQWFCFETTCSFETQSSFSEVANVLLLVQPTSAVQEPAGSWATSPFQLTMSVSAPPCKMADGLQLDLKAVIISFLSLSERLSACALGKTWHDAATHPDIWLKANLQNRKLQDQWFAALLSFWQKHKCAPEHLINVVCRQLSANGLSQVQQLMGLRYLHISHILPNHCAALEKALAALPALENLSIRRAVLAEFTLPVMANLHELLLYYFHPNAQVPAVAGLRNQPSLTKLTLNMFDVHEAPQLPISLQWLW